jgi:hypothetical protein
MTAFGLDITPQFIPDTIYEAVLISSYSLSVVTAALSTVMIVIRILRVSRIPGASRQPRIAMEIVVESATLYSISALVYVVIISKTSLNVETYEMYADVFFANMAVKSILHLSLSTSLI